MEKRILAVLIAAFAGAAYAQSTLAQSNYGSSARSAAPAPAAKSTQPEHAGATATMGNPPPPSDGYVGSGAGVVATNPFGLCWHGGAEWDAAKAAPPCDGVARVSTPPVPVVKSEPAPAPAPLAAAPAPRVIEKISLATDVLFAFNKAELTPAGEKKLDELARDAKGADVEKVVLVGHADRIGSEEYNQQLSEERAQAVADYLASQGVPKEHLQVEAKGKSEPITGDQCKNMGPESNKNQKLIACLQPDRRVDAELLGSRESASSSGSAPAGATSGSSSTSGSGTSGYSASPGSAGSSSSNSGSANTK